jgi:protein TonB
VAQPPLSDLRTLATGFQELSVKAVEPPPAPAPPPVAASAPPPAPLSPAPPRIYTSVDLKVIAPSTVRQDLPTFTGRLSRSTTGALEIVIDERGLVEMATIRQSVNLAYDRLAVDATRNWRYKPATVDGVPVKFKKIIQIAIKPAT